jgi:hypothetical protein
MLLEIALSVQCPFLLFCPFFQSLRHFNSGVAVLLQLAQVQRGCTDNTGMIAYG